MSIAPLRFGRLVFDLVKIELSFSIRPVHTPYYSNKNVIYIYVVVDQLRSKSVKFSAALIRAFVLLFLTFVIVLFFNNAKNPYIFFQLL